MKKIALAILTVAMFISGSNVFAQGKYGADSAECIKYLSYYKEYYKQKNLAEATPHWRKAYQLCPPTASQNMIIDGTAILRDLIKKNSKNAVYREALVDSLLTLHDVRANNFPKNAETARNNKAVDMSNFIKDDSKRLYEGYSEIIAANRQNTKPTVFLFNLNAAIDLFQQGALSPEDVINAYQTSVELLGQAEPKSQTDADQIAKVKTDLESLFITSKVASCENLIALFTPRYEAAPEDLELVSNIVKMMSITEGCMDNDLYLNAVTSMHRLNPSYNSAYFLYKLNAARGNSADAIKYLESAIADEGSDDATDGDYNYELAVFCSKNGMNVKAADAAAAAMRLNPALAGKANFLLGTIWGSVACGGNEIEKRAHFWVAVDYLQKAKAADATLTDDANKLIGTYSGYFPQTAEAFMYDVTNGQSYTVSCGGLRATTTVRTQK